MFKTAFLALGLIANSVSAQSTCTMHVEAFSDSTCSTQKAVEPLYPTGGQTLTYTFGQCLSQTGNSNDQYMKIAMCDADKFVAIQRYTDGACANFDSIAVTGFVPGDCTPFDESTYIRVKDVSLTGNRFGIGYFEAIGIFFCQTVLFGICTGLEDL